jgi:hypothetical protein
MICHDVVYTYPVVLVFCIDSFAKSEHITLDTFQRVFSRTVQLKPFVSMNSFDDVFLALRDREDVRLGDVSLVPLMLEFFGVAWEVYSMKTGMMLAQFLPFSLNLFHLLLESRYPRRSTPTLPKRHQLFA